MERQHIETPIVIELGSVSRDTPGSLGKIEEGLATQPAGGISDD